MANSFELRPLTVDNFEQSLEFLREHFFPFEPCAVNIDLCPYGYKIPALEDSIVEILAKGYSIGAFDGTKLYGILILDEKHADDVDPPINGNSMAMPEKFIKLDKFFTELCTNYGKGSSFGALKIQKILDVFIVCTSRTVAKQGLGKLLMSESIKIAKQNGFQGIQCMALSLYTQKICLKQGFDEIFSINYGDYIQDGKPFFDATKMGIHQEGILFARNI